VPGVRPGVTPSRKYGMIDADIVLGQNGPCLVFLESVFQEHIALYSPLLRGKNSIAYFALWCL